MAVWFYFFLGPFTSKSAGLNEKDGIGLSNRKVYRERRQRIE